MRLFRKKKIFFPKSFISDSDRNFTSKTNMSIVTTKKTGEKVAIYLSLLLLLVIYTSCQREQRDPIPDVSHIEIQTEVINYDSLVREAVFEGVDALEALMEEHPSFSLLFFEIILEIWNREEPIDSLHHRMRMFFESDFYRDISDTLRAAIPDMSLIEEDFREAFTYYQYYFPNRSTPPVYLFISEFAYGNVIFSHEEERDGLAVGLDMFLHDHFDYTVLSYFNTAFSGYNVRTFNVEHLVKKSFDAVWDDLLGPPPRGRMIDLMLYYGKKHHLNKLILPHKHDSVIFEYTPQQLEWANRNEAQIYNHLIEKDLLYTTDMVRYARLINPSPHSPGMPPEAPGRVVNWLGYKIVRAWVRNHPDRSLEEMLSITDGHEFLMQSRYRPGRF